MLLAPDTVDAFARAFNELDPEGLANAIPNPQAGAWMVANVPRFDCPDAELVKTWYFRWWTYRKHIRQTPHGAIVTEFLPDVPWAGPENSISCAAGFHFSEGRWLRDSTFLDDYARFWLLGRGQVHGYSFWIAHSMWYHACVTGDFDLVTGLLPELVRVYREWEHGWEPYRGMRYEPAANGEARLGPNGLFWQIDDRDGMEMSIGGDGYRATINSYLYGEAVAIARIARLAGEPVLAGEFRQKALAIRTLAHELLWDDDAQFFKVLPREADAPLADVRELHGYTPWAFHLAEPRCAPAWAQLADPQGFRAPFGPTTAEQRHPRFRQECSHECLWNGWSWPFATSMTLNALANLLHDYEQEIVRPNLFLETLLTYSRSHRFTRDDGRVIPWIDENLDPFTGVWRARQRLHEQNRPDKDRGRDYNHSSFADHVIGGLIGIRPNEDAELVVNPLIPPDTWDWFCLDGVPYHGHLLTVLYDRDGVRYNQGHGYQVMVDGDPVAWRRHPERLSL